MCKKHKKQKRPGNRIGFLAAFVILNKIVTMVLLKLMRLLLLFQIDEVFATIILNAFGPNIKRFWP